MPVRNGGATLRRALESVVAQTHKEMIIVISDNCSTDDTRNIALEFAGRDSRIQYVAQPHLLTVIEHFRYLVDQADTEYFMWAAHDDFRNDRYVELLLERLGDRQDAVLSFGGVVHFSEAGAGEIEPLVYDFDWTGLSLYRQIENVVYRKCSVMYGLIRTRCLQEYSWGETDYGSDVALLLYLRMRGAFVHAPGAVFYEFIVMKSPAERSRNEANRQLRRFWIARMALLCGTAVAEASTWTGKRPRRLRMTLLTYVVLKTDVTKLWLYTRAPGILRRIWHLSRRSSTPPA